MENKELKQAIAITTNGQVLQVGMPNSPDKEFSFINNFIGSAEPWEVYLTEIPEVVWSCKATSEYFDKPINAVATILIRSMYQNQVEPVRGNVLITGVGTDKDNFVSSVAPENIKAIIAYGKSIQKFLAVVENEFNVSLKKGEYK